MLCTTRPADAVDARATPALWHAMANPRQQRRPECSCRRQALGYRPSMAWYRASRSAISTIAPPLRNAGSGERSTGFFWDRNRLRNAVSTNSDIVRPWRAASRFSKAMTVSSICSVVFIWETIPNGWEYVKTIHLDGSERRHWRRQKDM